MFIRANFIELAGIRHHLTIMTFLTFLVLLLLAVFVLWNIWGALRGLGETDDDDTWGD